MATVTENKLYSQDATGYAEFIADLTAAHSWAKVETVSETETKFYDDGGNYIKVYFSTNIKMAPYNVYGKTYSDDLTTAMYVRFVTTKKTFGIFCNNSNTTLGATSVDGVIFTTSDGVPTIFGKHTGSASTPALLTMYNSTNENNSIAETDCGSSKSALMAVAIPASNKYSRCVCTNVMILFQNPFDTYTNAGAVTLDGKNYYMIGLLLLADD